MVQGQPTTSTVNNSLGIQYQTGFTIMCRVDCGAMYKLFGSSCSTADVRLVRLTHPPINLLVSEVEGMSESPAQ